MFTVPVGEPISITALDVWEVLPEGKAPWTTVQGRWTLYANPNAATPSFIPPGTYIGTYSAANTLIGTPTTEGDFSIGMQHTSSTQIKTYYNVPIIVGGEPDPEPDPEPGPGFLELAKGVNPGILEIADLFELLDPIPAEPFDSSWQFSTSSSLPPGMILASKTLSGTPTVPGLSYQIVMEWLDPIGSVSETATLVLRVTGEPDPEPDPEPSDFGMRVAFLMGFEDDPDFVALAGEHAPVIQALVKSYTRGGGFINGEPLEDVAAVIVTATARLAANPEQIAYQVGAVAFRGGFQGWSLAEQAVLNRYRKRSI